LIDNFFFRAIHFINPNSINKRKANVHVLVVYRWVVLPCILILAQRTWIKPF
jgi:hypothetical protein